MYSDLTSKLELKWTFKQDDWFIKVLFNRFDILYDIFRLKEYNASNIAKIIYEIDKDIKEYRQKLEEDNPQFLKKKEYLKTHENDDKIQITLDQEYALKDLIERYKIYEFIGWIHLGKNLKIFQECTIEKQKIINRIYPILDTTIRKVIGSKVIKLQDNNNELEFRKSKMLFDEAVNYTWTSIIAYLTKIDTSKVMFSIIVALAQKSAYFYRNRALKIKYNEKNLSSFNFGNDEDNDSINEGEAFLDYVSFNNDFNNLIESDIIEEIDSEYIMGADDEIDKIIATVDGGGSTTKYIQQCLWAYCFNILHGKIKKICFDRIFAEFFSDLINSDIPSSIIDKHTPIIVEIMNVVSIDPNLANDEDKNIEIYKMFRSWIKDKINEKLNMMNIKSRNLSDKSICDIVKREKSILDYLKENKTYIIENLLRFVNDSMKSSNSKKGE